MTRHRRIGRIWQSELLQSACASSSGHVIGSDEGEKAVEDDLIEIGAAELGADRSTDHPAALAEDGDRMDVTIGMGEERLFRKSALMPQRLQLPVVDLLPRL